MHLRRTQLERVERARPRVIRIAADAGWGKSVFVRALAARCERAVIVDLRGVAGREQTEARIMDALSDAGGTAGSLRAMWAAHGPDLVALEDLHLLDEAGLDVIRGLLRAMPEDRTIVMTARSAFPIVLSRYFAPHEIVALDTHDLALSREERADVIGDGRIDSQSLERAVELSRGWPICVFLFARFAREGRLTALLDRLEDHAFEDLYAYLEHEIVGDLAPEDLEALTLCAADPRISSEDVADVLGTPAVHRLRALVAQRLVVLRADGTYRAPLIAASLQRSRPDAVAAMRTRCADARSARGDHIGAAMLWMANGDAGRAAAALDLEGAPLPGAQPSRRYLRTLVSIPLAALLETRHAFVVLLTSQFVGANLGDFEEQARAVWERLPLDASREASISALLMVTVFVAGGSQYRRADELLDRLEQEHERAAFSPERARLMYATRAAVASLRGRVVEAAEIWRAHGLDDAEGRTVYEIQRFSLRIGIATAAGEHQRMLPDVLRNISMARESRDPVWIAQALVYQEVLLGGSTHRPGGAEETLRAIERDVLASVELERYLHITRANQMPESSRNVLSCIIMLDMAYEQSDPQTAHRMCDSAIATLDIMGRSHFQIGARMIAASIPGAARARLFDEARAIAADVQDPATLASIEAIAEGRYADAKCFPFTAGRVNRARFDIPETALRVCVLGGRVTRSGVPVLLRAREFEILTAIALARGPLSRDTLAHHLWGSEGAETAAAGLRTAIHRLRKQLGDPGAVIYENGAYRLSPFVTVDVVDIEATLAAFRRLETLTEREREKLAEIVHALELDPPALYAQWEWMAPHVLAIGELRRRATIQLIKDALEHDAPDDAFAVADAALLADPLDEPIVEFAILALLAGGRRVDAARRAKRYADELALELGGEPMSEMIRTLLAESRELFASN
jgi:DNA-binding SARP family transcriptional activator